MLETYSETRAHVSILWLLYFYHQQLRRANSTSRILFCALLFYLAFDGYSIHVLNLVEIVWQTEALKKALLSCTHVTQRMCTHCTLSDIWCLIKNGSLTFFIYTWGTSLALFINMMWRMCHKVKALKALNKDRFVSSCFYTCRRLFEPNHEATALIAMERWGCVSISFAWEVYSLLRPTYACLNVVLEHRNTLLVVYGQMLARGGARTHGWHFAVNGSVDPKIEQHMRRLTTHGSGQIKFKGWGI